jgi:hypothetical protein
MLSLDHTIPSTDSILTLIATYIIEHVNIVYIFMLSALSLSSLPIIDADGTTVLIDIRPVPSAAYVSSDDLPLHSD